MLLFIQTKYTINYRETNSTDCTHVTNDNLLGAEIWYLNTQHKNTEQIDARLR